MSAPQDVEVFDEEVRVSQLKDPEVKLTPKEQTAGLLAKVIVGTFATMMLFCCILTVIEAINHQELTESFELFKTVSAVMSGPLGFVLGFYFRES